MPRFNPATIVNKREETADSVILTLSVPDDVAAEYAYRQGQHVPVRAMIDGASVRRTYSMCASVADNTLRLGVRVQPGGVFSNYLAQLEVGDTLDVMQPTGRFFTELDPDQARTYVAFVAGSGITPILSIVKTTLETEPDSTFIVFYGNRKRATTMFIEDLYALKNRFGQRLALHFIMSQQPGEIDLYEGRLTADKLRDLHKAFLSELTIDDIFLCGPNPMIDELAGALQELDFDPTRIHSERFRPGLKGEATPRPTVRTTPKGGTEVTVIMDGQRQVFQMDPDDLSVLDAAQDNGLDLPYSCKGGVCSTCRVKLVDGEVAMALNYALEPWELEKGYILSCQATPKTKRIELDYDQA